MNENSELFRSYIATAVEVSLTRVRSSTHPISETDRQQAWHTLSYALAGETDWPAAGELLLVLAPKMAQAGYWREWIPYLEQGLRHARALHDLGMAAEFSLHLGHLYQRLGQLDRADRHAGDAEQIFVLLNNRRRQSAALNRQAEIARGRRDFPTVERLTNRALGLCMTDADSGPDVGSDPGSDPDTDSDPDIDLGERGHAFLIKGRSAFNQQDWSLADRHFEKALCIYQRTENLSRSAVCTQNLGRVRSMQEDYDGAIAYYQRAIGVLETVNDVFNLAAVRMNLGIAYSLSDRPYDALEQYSEAEPVFRRLDDRIHLAKNLNNQGMEMNNLERWAEAEQLLKASSALSLQMDNLQEYINAQDSLGLTYLGRGEFGRAVAVYEQALALSEERPERRFSLSTLADLTKHLRCARLAYEARA